jgi:arginyl-tRNA synthetase
MGSIEEDLAKMRVRFDNFFSEKTLYAKKSVEHALEVLKQKGYLFESEGALWFRSTDLGDDKDRVVKKSTGEYTYLAPDIAYHLFKYERGYNMLVNFWGRTITAISRVLKQRARSSVTRLKRSISGSSSSPRFTGRASRSACPRAPGNS